MLIYNKIRLYRGICLVVIANKTRPIFNLALQLFQTWISTYK